MTGAIQSHRAPVNAQTEAFSARRSAASHRWVLYFLGIISILAGTIAIVMPFLGTVTAAFVTGGVLIASGLAGLVTAFRRHEGWHVAAAFGLAVLSVAIGIAMFLQPLAGIVAFTMLVIAWFAASGLLRLYYGVKLWRDGGGWMLFTGALSVVVASLLWFSLPFSATWVLGLILGVDLVMWGALMIAFAIRVGRLPEGVEPEQDDRTRVEEANATHRSTP